MQLHYKKIGEKGTNIILLHGLLGSLDNMQTIAKQLSDTHQTYSIDQRNHGRSPHSANINYEILAEDIAEFCRQQKISKTNIIGHSMGGKTAMLFALNYPELIEQLIIVDIAPTYYDGGHETILSAMQNAPLQTTNKREDIDDFLALNIPEFGVRQFIMKNLTRSSTGYFEWKCNLEALVLNYNALMEFPKMNKVFLGNTYFIKGENSNYINQDNYEACDKYFPNHKIVEIKNASHWVHADNPTDFIEVVNDILYKPITL